VPADGADNRAPRSEGLRERKKRQMRQLLSDTATEMFLDRGFDAVRVAEIAAACGVSEKTVFNYFPTKESLLLDRWDLMLSKLRTGLADPQVSPVDAVRQILAEDLAGITSWLDTHADLAKAIGWMGRFSALIQTTPSLRAHQSDMMDRLTTVAAEILAQRAGVSPDDPEPQIAAISLLGLWQVQFRGLRKYLDSDRTPAEIRAAVADDVRRAARLLLDGLEADPK
jgi:AcrR family transcriptional regulator